MTTTSNLKVSQQAPIGLHSLRSGIISTLPCLDDIQVSRFRIHLVFPQGLDLERYPGFILHGALGAALHERHPAAYEMLFGERDIIKPWLITSPAGQLPPGGSSVFELRLFNDANELAPLLLAALTVAGMRGLGSKRQPFRIAGIDILRPGNLPELSLAEASATNIVFPAAAWCRPAAAEGHVRISFTSPLRLKDGNRLVHNKPEFHALMARTLGRAALLAHHEPLSGADKFILLDVAKSVAITNSRLRWDNQTRYSARQQRVMPFDGLIGDADYGPGSARFAPWLDLASILHLGGKTTFGLGGIDWHVLEEDSHV
jgi:hypothetical protein